MSSFKSELKSMGTNLLLLCLCVAKVWCQTTTSVTSAITATTIKTTTSKPENVIHVNVTDRSETWIELQWTEVSNDPKYNYTLQYSNGTQIADIPGSGDGPVNYNVSGLTPGTKYDFTLYTVFMEQNSIGLNFSEATAPENVIEVNVTDRSETWIELQWTDVSNDSKYNYTLQYSNGTQIADIPESGDGPVKYNVSGLTPGTEYDFTLFTLFMDVKSAGYNFSEVTAPENVIKVNVTDRSETWIKLQWTKVSNDPKYNYTLQYSNGTQIADIPGSGDGPVKYNVSGLTPGTEYDFTLYTGFMDQNSAGYNFSEVTAPENVIKVNVTDRSETWIKLQWTKVSNNPKYNYTLQYSNGTQIADIPGSGDGPVKYNVSGLTPGTEYDFTLYTGFMDQNSAGYNFSEVTAPENVIKVNVTDRSETWIKLQWTKVFNDPKYNYTLQYSNGTQIADIPGSGDGPVKYNVSGLTPGTEYDFTLYTVLMDVKSTGCRFLAITIPKTVDGVNVKQRSERWIELQWNNVYNDPKYNYSLEYENKIFKIPGSKDGPVKYNVSGLTPGTEYNFALFTVFMDEKSTGHHFSSVTIPPKVDGLQCEYMSGGYQFSLTWWPPQGVWTEIVVQMPGRSPHNVTGTETKTVIGKVQPARTYHMTVTSWSRGMKSEPVSFECMTDPRGVIGGSVLGVLLFAVVVLLVVFIFRRKPELLSPKFFVESKISSNNYKPIPIGKFEAHFNNLSCDENRGFSVEYEDFSHVGTEQTCKAADLQQNRVKNRFTNVLPYDWARVKLSVINGDPCSDYINACYMPGYGNNVRQYIAAQGPLPSTVNDFWRMIWEQKVHGIVMVTNCNEGGRVKCDQYWPLDYTPCTYGELLVRVSSENKESSWTLREFVVTNRVTSEVRSVNHFHFTAWPDHGVPNGTTELIQFRALVRQHIERCGSVGPTVVHCSAGVGRTGTLIALDVTLQQMEREKAVGLAAFVHKMRLSRPLMVQTESQYIFLHQCIMDCLKPKLKELPEDPLYENVDTIYINATALKEFHSTNTNA